MSKSLQQRFGTVKLVIAIAHFPGLPGPETGVPFAMSELQEAKSAVPQTPVFANTGVRAAHLAEILAIADGVIVGTSLKVDGVTWKPKPVDSGRARRIMDTARQIRSAPAPAR